MKNTRRQFHWTTISAILATSCIAMLPAAHAETWPDRPVTMVVPFPPGGTTDVLARSLAEQLARKIKQPVIVDNRPGAGATVGAEYVARAKPDGYTLLIGAVHHTIAPSVYPKLNYDFQKDLEPLTNIAVVPNVLVVNAERTEAKNLQSWLEEIKTTSGGATYGSNGNGTAQHMIGTQFQQQTGTELVHVPYRGSGPLTADLLGGQIMMSFDTLTPVLPHIRSGKLRPLAVTTATRSNALPDVPTLAESGLQDFNIGTWFGVLAPKNTPEDLLVRLNKDMVEIIQSPEFSKRMDEIGAQVVGNSRQEFGQQIAEETQRFEQLVKSAGVKLE